MTLPFLGFSRPRSCLTICGYQFTCLPTMGLTSTITDSIAVGDWTQVWQENGIYSGSPQTFTKMEIFVIDGNPWQSPALISFSDSSWHFVSRPNPNYAVASGNAISPTPSSLFLFTTQGVDPQTNPFTWDLVWWNGNNIVGFQRSTWNGVWQFQEILSPYPSENRSVVPIPASVLLLGSGLMGLGLLGWRRKSS